MSDSLPRDVVGTEWDVVIIGAGIAGASAAILAAGHGLSTLLLEAKKFPREKVCGGCLNQRAIKSLERLGLGESLKEAGAVTITEFHIQIRGRSFRWPIPAMLSIRRSTLDQMMVDVAQKAGARFIDEAKATVIPHEQESAANTPLRRIQIQSENRTVTVIAKTVLVADGLTRSSLHQDKGWKSVVEPHSRIGVQQVANEGTVFPKQSDGCLTMFVERDGYIGISRTDGGMCNVAAAISPELIRSNTGIRQAISGLSGNSVDPSVNLDGKGQWSATPALTRYSDQVAGHRIFLLGDAIGYVEPFTGEGMSWALASSEAVIPLVLKNVREGWSPKLDRYWTKWIRQQRKRKQWTCRWIAHRLRQPQFAYWFVRLCDVCVPLRTMIIKKVTS
jgi:menaquinone-9 beta-reductase